MTLHPNRAVFEEYFNWKLGLTWALPHTGFAATRLQQLRSSKGLARDATHRSHPSGP